MNAKDSITSFFGIAAAPRLPVSPSRASLRSLQNSTGLLSRAWKWIRSQQASRSSSKRLQVASTVSLGEKRFVAVIQVDGLQFLIGGGATTVTLLAQLDANDAFGSMLNKTISTPKKQPVKRKRKHIVKPPADRTVKQA